MTIPASKVRIWNVKTGKHKDVWTVDAKEILRFGDYVGYDPATAVVDPDPTDDTIDDPGVAEMVVEDGEQVGMDEFGAPVEAKKVPDEPEEPVPADEAFSVDAGPPDLEDWTVKDLKAHLKERFNEKYNSDKLPRKSDIVRHLRALYAAEEAGSHEPPVEPDPSEE